MLTATRCVDAERVLAKWSQRFQGPFQCSSCGEEAVLAKGPIRVHHFRHRPDARICFREAGESAAHRDAKDAIYTALREREGVTDVDMERPIGENIADVFAVIRGAPVAIEVQRSRIDIDSIVARTTAYHRSGVAVLWLALLSEEVCFNQYRPSNWERWCHAAYWGRVYFWAKHDEVQPVHFGPYTERVPRSSWPGANGVAHEAGGYERISSRFKNPSHGERVRIGEHFRPQVRPAWEGGTVSVPRCSLLVDSQAVWWKD